jgi:methylphosphotriester-DNA--protein-cysteine methyltransferase
MMRKLVQRGLQENKETGSRTLDGHGVSNTAVVRRLHKDLNQPGGSRDAPKLKISLSASRRQLAAVVEMSPSPIQKQLRRRKVQRFTTGERGTGEVSDVGSRADPQGP